MSLKKKEIVKLRKEFRAAYKFSTGKIIYNSISQHKSDTYYKPIRTEINLRLGVLLDVKKIDNVTIRKFLFEKENLNFYPETLKIFEDYIEAVNKTRNTELVDEIESNLQGAILIDYRFLSSFMNIQAHEIKDFYRAKKHRNCQWRGVINDLDCRRDIESLVLDKVLLNRGKSQSVIAAIIGDSGVGKSTFLRRLAITLFEHQLKILWIEDFETFYEKSLSEQLRLDSSTIVILEDWSSIRNVAHANTFLDRISAVSHIKAIIGDRAPAQTKEYYHHIDVNNIFELTTQENSSILYKAVLCDDHWLNWLHRNIRNPSIKHAPIITILFLMSRLSVDSDEGISGDIETEFRRAVFRDMDRLCEIYPGLCIALHYWSCIYTEYRIHITWSALLKIADYYSNSVISNRLKIIDKQSVIMKLLSHYLSIEEIMTFDGSFTFIVLFHHDLIPTEGISRFLKPNWHPLDQNIQYEIAKTLYERAEHLAFFDFYHHLASKIHSNNLAIQLIFGSMKNYLLFLASYTQEEARGLNSLKHYNNSLQLIYRMPKAAYSNVDWLREICYWVVVARFQKKAMVIILNKLVEMGCTHADILSILTLYENYGEKAVQNAVEKEIYSHITDPFYQSFIETMNCTKKCNEAAQNVYDLAQRPNYLDNSPE